VSIPVSTETNEWIAAEILRDNFTFSLDGQDLVLDLDAGASIELSARFLSFVAERVHDKTHPISARLSVLSKVFEYFTFSYLSNNDVHTVASSLNAEVRVIILSSYFLALFVLEQQKVSDIPRGPPSALLSTVAKGDASAFALFGGQGTNEVYFDELQSLYDIYKPYVDPFITTITREVLESLAAVRQDTLFYTYGMNVIAWLSGAVPRPPLSYLASVPVSSPLIGLTQIVQYLVVCRVSNLTPAELRSRIAGATGHSQGLVSAVAIAASDTFQSFTDNARKAIKWLFFSGLRGQQAFPVTSLEPSIIQDTLDNGEGVPSPMLSITGLPFKELEPHVKKTNSHLPEISKLTVSLHNGPRAFVITGPARSLYGLVTNLRKIRAPSGLDQSKTPFSQRKPVFSVRFLVVGVPYHSKYLEGAGEKLCMDDLEGEELWMPEDLQIPVFNTETGNVFPPPRSSRANVILVQDPTCE
jgi:fatty acid synthase subunit alpha